MGGKFLGISDGSPYFSDESNDETWFRLETDDGFGGRVFLRNVASETLLRINKQNGHVNGNTENPNRASAMTVLNARMTVGFKCRDNFIVAQQDDPPYCGGDEDLGDDAQFTVFPANMNDQAPGSVCVMDSFGRFLCGSDDGALGAVGHTQEWEHFQMLQIEEPDADLDGVKQSYCGPEGFVAWEEV